MPVKVPVVFFHEWLHAASEHSKTQFAISVLGAEGQAGVNKFWAYAMREEWAQKHEVVARHPLEVLLPFTLHLDGGEVHRNQELYFFNMGSLLASGASFLRRQIDKATSHWDGAMVVGMWGWRELMDGYVLILWLDEAMGSNMFCALVVGLRDKINHVLLSGVMWDPLAESGPVVFL